MQEFISKSGKKIIVRDITLNDVDRLYDYITELGMEDTYIHVNPQSLITYEEEITFVTDCIKKIANRQMIKLLAFHDDELVGVVDVNVQPRRMKHIGRLGITIKKAYRGDGIGKKLIQLAIKEAEVMLSLNQITLGCFANNSIALALYENMGFKEYGRLPKGIFRKGDYTDEVLMYKEINSEK